MLNPSLLTYLKWLRCVLIHFTVQPNGAKVKSGFVLKDARPVVWRQHQTVTSALPSVILHLCHVNHMINASLPPRFARWQVVGVFSPVAGDDHKTAAAVKLVFAR